MNAQNTRSLWESEQNTRSLWESEPATSVNAQNTRSHWEKESLRESQPSKLAVGSQIVSHILRMWRLMNSCGSTNSWLKHSLDCKSIICYLMKQQVYKIALPTLCQPMMLPSLHWTPTPLIPPPPQPTRTQLPLDYSPPWHPPPLDPITPYTPTIHILYPPLDPHHPRPLTPLPHPPPQIPTNS